MMSGTETAGTAMVSRRRIDSTRLWHIGVPLMPIILGLFGSLMSGQLGVWDETRPGPGFYPLLASLIIIGTGVSLSLRRNPGEVEAGLPKEASRVLLGVCVLLVYAVAFTLLGVVTTSFITCLLWLKLLARMPWRSSLLISAGASVAIYLLFVRVLQLPLPLDAFLGR